MTRMRWRDERGGVMVEKKGGGGVSTHAEEVECTGDAQCCRRSGGHTREQLLNNPRLQSEVTILIGFLSNKNANIVIQRRRNI